MDRSLVVSTVDLVLFPYTDSLHATMSDDDKGKKTRPLFIFRASKPFSLPATTHHVTSLLKILNLVTRETNLTSAWNTLTSLHVGCHGLSFSWQKGVAKAVCVWGGGKEGIELITVVH